MYTLDRDRLNKIASWSKIYGNDHNIMIPASEAEELVSRLLAAEAQLAELLGQEPYGWDCEGALVKTVSCRDSYQRSGVAVVPLFSNPVPPAASNLASAGWQACRDGHWFSIKAEDVPHYRDNEEVPVREVYVIATPPAAIQPENSFISHIKDTKERVSQWPEWKQNLMGDPRYDAPATPLVNEDMKTLDYLGLIATTAPQSEDVKSELKKLSATLAACNRRSYCDEAFKELTNGEVNCQPYTVPDGWALVPEYLTPEMRAAWDSAPFSEDDDENMRTAYNFMLYAAPRYKGE